VKRTAPRALALIDGEHHPQVVRDALERAGADYEISGVLFVGGQEKLGLHVLEDPPEHYGCEVTVPRDGTLHELRSLAVAHPADVVLDLSGEPVLAGADRMRIACLALDLGLEYRNADTRISPPPQETLEADVPLVSVIGTGKRTGKTAIGGHLARLLDERGQSPIVVSMGRGGPPEPQLVRASERPGVEDLIELARRGRHAASDYLEDAVLAGVTTVGCRRCGEGLAGATNESNVVEGTRLALSLDPGVVVVEGSGAAFPPVRTDRTVCVTSAPLVREQALSFLGPFRLMRSDLVVMLGSDLVEPSELATLKGELEPWCGDVLTCCKLESLLTAPVDRAARVAVFTTAGEAVEPAILRSLAEQGVEPVLFSRNLARREDLEHDLDRACDQGCDVFATELKAAAIDRVAERAASHGAKVVFIRNRPVALPGEPDLDEQLLALVASAKPTGSR
jgi:cyclic 2,3-diphosphoglycerate synthetase